jgi:hypothetical protein
MRAYGDIEAFIFVLSLAPIVIATDLRLYRMGQAGYMARRLERTWKRHPLSMWSRLRLAFNPYVKPDSYMGQHSCHVSALTAIALIMRAYGDIEAFIFVLSLAPIVIATDLRLYRMGQEIRGGRHQVYLVWHKVEARQF